MTKVININEDDRFDEYIGRRSKWGNPYVIGVDGDRDEVITKFKYDFERGFLKFSKKDVLELKGKTLGCHCKPAACHGDVLVEYLNSLDAMRYNMSTVSGTVEVKARNGAGIKLNDDNWYNAPPEIFGKVNKGDKVTFEVVKAGRGFKVLSMVGEPEITSGSGDGSSGTTAVPYREKQSLLENRPLRPEIHSDRLILRQNALTAAVNLVNNERTVAAASKKTSELTSVQLADHVVDVAKLFEAYTSGDKDCEDVLKKYKDSMRAE